MKKVSSINKKSNCDNYDFNYYNDSFKDYCDDSDCDTSILLGKKRNFKRSYESPSLNNIKSKATNIINSFINLSPIKKEENYMKKEQLGETKNGDKDSREFNKIKKEELTKKNSDILNVMKRELEQFGNKYKNNAKISSTVTVPTPITGTETGAGTCIYGEKLNKVKSCVTNPATTNPL